MKRLLSAMLAVLLLCAPGAQAFATARPATPPPSPSPAATPTSAQPGTATTASPLPSGATPLPTPEPSPTPEPAPIPLAVSPSRNLLKEGAMGDEVVLMQMRLKDLGYFSYKVTGVYGSFTSKAVEAFQRANGLNPDGHMGETTASYLYSPTAKRGVGILRATPTPTPKATPRPTKPTYGKLIDWKDASGKVARWNGPKFQIRDFYTGVTYYVYRVGGSNHMDIAPASKDDTAKLKRTYGGRWTWSRRPVLVRLGGTWYAASINGMPHNEAASVKGNGMDGQICLHFLNSKTHIHNAKDPEHQRCVQIAAGKKK